MAIETSSTTLKTPEGEMLLHVARPQGEARKLPAILLIMEAFGLNGHIKSVAGRLAAEGYHVVAPDVYYRNGPGVVVGYDELPKAIELMNALGDDQVVSDMKALVAQLKADPGVRGDRIGISGFCMGGRISYLTACEIPEIRATVSYYGGGIAGQQFNPAATAPAGKTASMKGAMLLHFGSKDTFIPLEVVEQVRESLDAAEKEYELHVYEGADHGFHCDERPSYHEASAKTAWERTLAFFAEHLKG